MRILFETAQGELENLDGETVGVAALALDDVDTDLIPTMTTLSEVTVAWEVTDAPGYGRDFVELSYSVEPVTASRNAGVVRYASSVATFDLDGAAKVNALVFFRTTGADDTEHELLFALGVEEGPGFTGWTGDEPEKGLARVSAGLVHNDLDGRSSPDAHTIESITGLVAALAEAAAGGGGGGAPTVQMINKTAASPGTIAVDLSSGADQVADGVGLVIISGPSGGDSEFVVSPPERSTGLALGLLCYCPGHFTTVTIPAFGPFDEATVGPTVVPVLQLLGSGGGPMVAQTSSAGGGGGGPSLSDDDPESLGTADPGTSPDAARSDHVHQLPTAAGIGAQPADSDLTAIAALTTTSFGRALLELANAAAGRTALSLVIGTDVQAHDGDLDAVAALTTTTFGRALLELANAGALRTAAGVVIGTDVQAFHANLAAFAGLSLVADRLAYANGSGTLSLTTLTSFARTLLDDPDAATALATLGAVPGSRTLAGLDLTADRSAAALKTALTLVKGDVGLGSVTNDEQIPKSLVTTKGDLVVATGSATPARLAVGAAGTTPVSNSNETAGLGWVGTSAPIIFESGQMVALAPYVSATAALTSGRITYFRFRVPRRVTFDRFGVNHISGVSTTGDIRLGIYLPSAVGGGPGALLHDITSGGTINPTTAAAIKLISGSWALDPGDYWYGVLGTHTGTAPTLGFVTTIGSFVFPEAGGAGNTTPFQNSLSALPTPSAAGYSAGVNQAPVMYARPA